MKSDRVVTASRVWFSGQGLVEILVAIVCFIAAILPIISIFTFNMENAKVIQAKSITYAAAAEIVHQIVLIPVRLLKMKAGAPPIAIPAVAVTHTLVTGEDATRLSLTALPSGYTREIRIEPRGSGQECFRVTVSVKTSDQPRGNIEMGQTVSSNQGGR